MAPGEDRGSLVRRQIQPSELAADLSAVPPVQIEQNRMLCSGVLVSFKFFVEFPPKTAMNNRRFSFSFFRGFMRGLGSPVDIYRVQNYRSLTSSTECMRSDWNRIGDDFRTVMARQHGEAVKAR